MVSSFFEDEVNFPSSFFDCDMRDKSVPADQRKEDGMYKHSASDSCPGHCFTMEMP